MSSFGLAQPGSNRPGDFVLNLLNLLNLLNNNTRSERQVPVQVQGCCCFPKSKIAYRWTSWRKAGHRRSQFYRRGAEGVGCELLIA